MRLITTKPKKFRSRVIAPELLSTIDHCSRNYCLHSFILYIIHHQIIALQHYFILLCFYSYYSGEYYHSSIYTTHHAAACFIAAYTEPQLQGRGLNKATSRGSTQKMVQTFNFITLIYVYTIAAENVP